MARDDMEIAAKEREKAHHRRAGQKTWTEDLDRRPGYSIGYLAG